MKDLGKIHYVNKVHLLNAFHVPDPVIVPENAQVRRTQFVPVLLEFSNNKQTDCYKLPS